MSEPNLMGEVATVLILLGREMKRVNTALAAVQLGTREYKSLCTLRRYLEYQHFCLLDDYSWWKTTGMSEESLRSRVEYLRDREWDAGDLVP